jgi:tetratricopeptide (TPR) repeat protein
MNYYDKNIAVLEKTAPEVVRWLERGEPGEWAEMVRTRSGLANLRMIDEEGEPFLVYDGVDPAAIEREAVGRLPAAKGKGTFLFGFGLGYRAAVLAEEAPPEHVLFVVEEKPAVVKLALETVDLSQPLADHTLMFVSTENGMLDRLIPQSSHLYRRGEIRLITDERCWRYFSASFKQEVTRFTQAVVKQAQNESAYIHFSRHLMDNTIANLALTLLSPDVSNLKGILTGVPAVVVSAGPSLAEGMPFLAEASGKAALVATAPVLRVLSAHDIIPDLMGVMDFTPGNYQVLTDVYATEEVPLVFLEAVLPDVIREYQGDLFSVLQSSGTVRAWLGRHLDGRDHWEVGSNVGGFCLDLALYLGADPIILVGQDLSFPGKTVHCEGVAGECRTGPGPEAAKPVWLDSTADGKVLSNLTFASYLEAFQRTIAAHPDRTFINTSLQGARIEGTIEMPLDEAMEKYCQREHPIISTIRRALTGPREDFSGLWSELTGLDDELEALGVVTGKAVEFSREILELIAGGADRNNERLQHLIKVHAEYKAGVDKYWRVFEPLKQYLSLPLDEYFEKAAANAPDGIESTVHAAELNQSFMSAARDGSIHLHQRLETARQELSAIITASTAEERSTLEFQLNLARSWADLGRLNTAWTYYRSALALAPENQDLLLEAARVCLKRERPRAAYELVRRILERDTELHPAHVLEKEILDVTGQWQKRAADALETEDWVTALLLSRKLLAFDPDRTEYRQMECRALEFRTARLERAKDRAAERHRRKQVLELTAEAEEAFNQARFDDIAAALEGRLDPEREEDHKALVLLGVSLLALGRTEQALPILHDLQNRRPQWPYMAARLGVVLVKGGRVDSGIDLLEKAGLSDGAFRSMLFEAGCLRMKAGDFNRAIQDFEDYLAANPSSYEALNKLAICHLALGRPKSARHYFQRTLAIQPDSEAARLGLEKCGWGEEEEVSGCKL